MERAEAIYRRRYSSRDHIALGSSFFFFLSFLSLPCRLHRRMRELKDRARDVPRDIDRLRVYGSGEDIHPHMAATRHGACFARRSATDYRARIVDNGSVDEEVKIDGGMRLRSAVVPESLLDNEPGFTSTVGGIGNLVGVN